MKGPSATEVRKIFSNVAAGYDLANDAMTFGLARLWRKEVVQYSGVRLGEKVLDCATGTGDLALEFKKAVGPEGTVIGTDFCQEMLDRAPIKAKKENLAVDFQLADVMDLPFEDDEFDVCSIAYGIRNVSDPEKALEEMARVVRPGGCVVVLETGDTPDPRLRAIMRFYLNKIVPRIGGWLTGQREAYEYLSRSSQAFPSRDAFLKLMNKSNSFRHLSYRSLMGGASFIYKGIVR